MSQALHQLVPGTVVEGRFEIRNCLSDSDQSTIYLCRNIHIPNLQFVLKVPKLCGLSKVAMRRAFREQVAIQKSINSASIVCARSVLESEKFIACAMEYVSGGSVENCLRQGQHFTILEALSILSDVSLGLQAIHDSGLLHCNLQPSNVLLDERLRAKITDFSLAHKVSETQSSQFESLSGSIDYMSPEYLHSGQLDVRYDVYALGVLAYKLFTGKLPYAASTEVHNLSMRLQLDPPAPSSLSSDCGEEIDILVLNALTRNPESRYQTVNEFYRDLLYVRGIFIEKQSEGYQFGEDSSDSSGKIAFQDENVDATLETELIVPSERELETYSFAENTRVSGDHPLFSCYTDTAVLLPDFSWIPVGFVQKVENFTLQISKMLSSYCKELEKWHRVASGFARLFGAAVQREAKSLLSNRYEQCVEFYGRKSPELRAWLQNPTIYVRDLRGLYMSLLLLFGFCFFMLFKGDGKKVNSVTMPQSVALVKKEKIEPTALEASPKRAEPNFNEHFERLLAHASLSQLLPGGIEVREELREVIVDAGENGGEAEVPYLVIATTLEDSTLRAEAVRALSRFDFIVRPGVLTALLIRLEDPEYLVRGFAAKSLALVPSATALQILRRRLDIEKHPVAIKVINRTISRIEEQVQ